METILNFLKFLAEAVYGTEPFKQWHYKEPCTKIFYHKSNVSERPAFDIFFYPDENVGSVRVI